MLLSSTFYWEKGERCFLLECDDAISIFVLVRSLVDVLFYSDCFVRPSSFFQLLAHGNVLAPPVRRGESIRIENECNSVCLPSLSKIR